MKELKAKQNFFMGNTFYAKDDIVKVSNIKDVIVLNEKGFIEPLNVKELQEYKDLFEKKVIKDKEVKNGTII